MLLKHLLELLCIERSGTIIIKLEEYILNIVLRLQLIFSLHVEFFGCTFVTREEPVLGVQASHYIAHIAKV